MALFVHAMLPITLSWKNKKGYEQQFVSLVNY
jgi:hypothetical protein